MRRATWVLGTSLGLVVASASVAQAVDVPASITLNGGTVAVGSLPQATATAPSTMAGTISSETFASSFPTVALTDATATGVDFGLPYGKGDLTVSAVAGAFTGTLNVLANTYDLSGPVAYTLTAKVGATTYACKMNTVGNLTLSGLPDLQTGAFAVSGSRVNGLLTGDLASTAFCTALALKAPAIGTTTTKYAGAISVPGVVPAPTIVTPPTVVPPPVTPPTVVPPPPTVKPTPTKKAPKLTMKLSNPTAVVRGRTAVMSITITNPGTARARAVKINIRRPAGTVASRKSITYSSLPAGRSKTIRVRFRTTKKTVTRPKVTVTATATGLKVTRNRTLRVRAAR